MTSDVQAMSAEAALSHIRQTVIVVDEFGTILQHMGSSLGILGYATNELVGTNALDHIAPEHYESMLFAFFGPDDRIVRSKHLPFKLGLVDRNGDACYAECCGERVWVDERYLWIVTLMPHPLQSASFLAVQDFGAGASSIEIAETVAASLSMQWDDAFEIRSFLLAGHDGHHFTTIVEPGRSADAGLAARITPLVETDAPWNRGISDIHVVLPVTLLPADVAEAALSAGFAAVDLAVACLEGKPKLALLTFALHEHAFEGNIDMILRDSIQTIEMTLERERDEELLTVAAEHDPLTGLVNRSRFAAALEQSAASTAVLFIDLDEFKQINDSFGHVVGDAVLVEVARRISGVCRPGDVVTRLGGDEFAVLLADVDTAGATHVSQRVLDAIAEPLPSGLGPTEVYASGGLATAESDATLSVERADLAMLRGKRAGRGRLVVV